VLVLDRMLPDLDGLDLLRLLRTRGIRTPALMLTALGGVEDRVAGLDAGADDYLAKPFAFAELLARVRALGRRATALPAPRLAAGDLELDEERHVPSRGSSVDLSAASCAPGLPDPQRGPGRDPPAGARCGLGRRADVYSNVVDLYVSYIRRKLVELGSTMASGRSEVSATPPDGRMTEVPRRVTTVPCLVNTDGVA